MPNINDIFPSKYLKASDIANPTLVTIASIAFETLGDDQKMVVYFQGATKGLVMNKTNSTNVANLYGPETDGWINKQMMIVPTFVDFQGQSTPAIRLHPPQVQAQPLQPAPAQIFTQPNGQQAADIHQTQVEQPQPSGLPEQTPSPQNIDDEIPF